MTVDELRALEPDAIARTFWPLLASHGDHAWIISALVDGSWVPSDEPKALERLSGGPTALARFSLLSTSEAAFVIDALLERSGKRAAAIEALAARWQAEVGDTIDAILADLDQLPATPRSERVYDTYRPEPLPARADPQLAAPVPSERRRWWRWR